MRQNIAFLLFFVAGLVAECIPVMLVLVGLGLIIKKSPAKAGRKKINYVYSNPHMRKCQGGNK